jgi:uncharacterized membrane protein YeaQ/YmgE (transglycosylase-associated protein family)
MKLLQFLIVGLLAGWIMGRALRGKGFGLIGNLIIGVLGSVVGGFLAGFFGWSVESPFASILAAVTGAAVLFFILSFVRPSRSVKKADE